MEKLSGADSNLGQEERNIKCLVGSWKRADTERATKPAVSKRERGKLHELTKLGVYATASIQSGMIRAMRRGYKGSTWTEPMGKKKILVTYTA